jgi:hypothetical protein
VRVRARVVFDRRVPRPDWVAVPRGLHPPRPNRHPRKPDPVRVRVQGLAALDAQRKSDPALRARKTAKKRKLRAEAAATNIGTHR